MDSKLTISETFEAFSQTDLDTLEVGTGDEPTTTPGIFYHGSPHSDLVEFNSQIDVHGAGRRGVYFTNLADQALVYAVGRHRGASGRRGRIYTVELVTRNEFAVPKDFWDEYWNEEVRGARELAAEQEAIAGRHDCIVTAESHGYIFEVIVLDRSAIRCRSVMGAPAMHARRALSSGIFYSIGDLPGPDYAPDCPLLFSSRDRAEAACGVVRQVVAETGNAIYCDCDVWDQLNVDDLRELRVDCLVDPSTGDALLVNRTPPRQLNRAARRTYLKMKKRSAHAP
jgi:hypothetical protein